MEERGRPMDTDSERRYQGAQLRLVSGEGRKAIARQRGLGRAPRRSPMGPGVAGTNGASIFVKMLTPTFRSLMDRPRECDNEITGAGPRSAGRELIGGHIGASTCLTILTPNVLFDGSAKIIKCGRG